MANVDFRYEDHGSIALIVPLTDAGRDVLMVRAPEDACWWGEGLVVEPRYVGPFLEALDDEGFSVSDGRVD